MADRGDFRGSGPDERGMTATRRRLRVAAMRRTPLLLSSSIAGRILGYASDGNIVVDRLGRFPLSYDRTSEIGGALFAAGTFEASEIDAIERILQRVAQPTILDIGANVGVHSIAWAHALDGAR